MTALAQTPDPGPLELRLRLAGAVLCERDGHVVPARFGSVVTEMALCLSAAGVADRADLEAVEVWGRPPAVDAAISALGEEPGLAVGAARRLGRGWMGRGGAGSLVLVGRRSDIAAWTASLAAVPELGGLHRPAQPSPAAVAVVGQRWRALLAAAGLPADLFVGAFARTAIGHAIVRVLREADDRVLLLVAPAAVEALWERLLAAGRPLGASAVGCEALERLAAAGR